MRTFTRLALVMLTGGASVSPVHADRIRCESSGHREQSCPADTRGGVALMTQTSRAGCFQNSTWGYDDRGIWVSGGCAAEFETGPAPEAQRGSKGAAAAAIIGAMVATAVINPNSHGGDPGYHGPGYGPRGDGASPGQQPPSYGGPPGYYPPLGTSAAASAGVPAKSQMTCIDEGVRYFRTRRENIVAGSSADMGGGTYEVKLTVGNSRASCTVDSMGNVRRIFDDN